MNRAVMTDTEELIFKKLESIEGKVDQLPTKETVKDWIGTAVLQHTMDCINRKKAFPSVPPDKQAIISDVAKERFKFWGVLATLATLIGERFLNQ